MSDYRKPGPPPKPNDRVVKVQVETEQVVLAAMLVDAATRRKLLRALPLDRWQVAQHKPIVVALAELDRRSIEYDPAALKRLFPDVDVEYLAELAAARPTVPENLQHYVQGVLWDATRVDAVQGPIASILEALADPLSDPGKIRGLARAVADAFGAWREKARVIPAEQVADDLEAELRARAAGQAVYPFGIPGIDLYQDEPNTPPRLIPAAKPGKITCITGTSGSGKSTMACRIALGQARQKRRTLYGAWEMTHTESIELLAVMSLAEEGVDVSRRKLMTGTADEAMIAAAAKRGRQIAPFVRFVPNPFQRGTKGETNDGNLGIIQTLIEDMGADVFIADLWDRCLVETEPDDVRAALFRQQQICDATKCHGILLQQQRSKDIETRADKRPTREGIIGSGAWVDIADTILGCYRPAQWKAIPDDIVVVDVLKQRHAPWPLSVEVEWDPDRAFFGAGVSVAYDQPGGREGPSDFDSFTGSGGKKGRR